MNDKQLMALALKNANKAARAQDTQKKARKYYDSTLEATRPQELPEGGETEAIFQEMKRRSF